MFKMFSVQKVCRTRMIGNEFFECRVKRANPQYCEHSLCMGGGFICNHPDRVGFSK